MTVHDGPEDSAPASYSGYGTAVTHDAQDGTLFRTGRVHIAARQRGVDGTALVGLALRLPHVLASATVVCALSYAVAAAGGPPWWLLLAGWALSGALAFHRPCERLMARWLFDLRHPAPEEAVLLGAVWREVTARAGVDGSAYQLWVEDSDEVNAMATAGHIVGVTSHSVRTLSPAQLAGVLAHELGHHTRGHAWAALLASWYALPARLVWRLLLRLLTRMDRMPTGVSVLSAALLGTVVIVLATATYGLVFLPLATPCLTAAVSRRAELRADGHAAGLGFAPELMTVLRAEQDRGDAPPSARRVLGSVPGRAALTARLLNSHPDVHTRLHHLQARLERTR
ncbi:M48 family metalloprotease [Streptomyces naphthomycinicus]|uniref:M48 family metalloprotease n=1 Tax=Streptomyces naphthomycinicus TaxID=2872625 RepID=UPI001CED6805|nr:M48 family metalloprotease [Streptomyces sp. TML10]